MKKIGIGYELPLSSKLLLDVNAGIGGANIIDDSEISYRLQADSRNSYYGVFMKGQLRYYISRKRRTEKGRFLGNNVGSFAGLQSKFNFNNDSNYIGNALLTDIHFGQQLPLGKKIIFRYHLGVGYARNLKFDYSSIYPAVNAVFGYSF